VQRHRHDGVETAVIESLEHQRHGELADHLLVAAVLESVHGLFPHALVSERRLEPSKPKSMFLHSSHTNVAKAVGSPQRPQTGLPTWGSASKQGRQSTPLERRSQPTQRWG
jgi:hypothetical protein